ncbi:MAG: xanthine dehydrogenase accessory factor [Phycisphaerales bacterium]|jgi:xanthine dehydrogenase accessory factor|nr:xanthine dehydrogenase accessory factor [Phycisphaerales bacterium]
MTSGSDVVSDPVLDELVRRCSAGEAVALCTVVSARGSTPQAAGARMLLLGDGKTIGTLGGGCVEAEVRQQAIKLLHAGLSKLLNFKLDHDYGWDDGLICGGSMDIFVETMTQPRDAEDYQRALAALREGRSADLAVSYDVEGQPKTFRETLEPPGKLLIVGAGHVGQALAALAASLQFHVSVLDDRSDCASAERFPSAARHVADIESSLRAWPIDAQTYIVIVTRGHRHDGKALAAVIDSPAKYVGLIGSKRKVKTIFEDLLAQGAPLEKLLRVHAPIGLEIGAVTVPEIALSIAAELVAVRRGRGGAAALPMKFDATKLRELLEIPQK